MERKSYIIRLSRHCYYVLLGIVAVLLGIYGILLCKGVPITKIYPYPCLLYSSMHFYCPGCGGTRAVEYLLKGHLIKSFIYHPVVPYTALLVICYIISHTLNIISKGKIKAMLFRPIYFYIMIAIILLQCIIKNLLIIIKGIYII